MEEQKRKRLTSEKSLQHDTFKLKLGTTDKTNPLVVYIEGGVFITPNEEKDSYVNDVKAIKYGLKKTIRENLSNNNFFVNDYILEFQIADKGIKTNKKSFLTFDLMLKQPSGKILKLNDVKKHAEQNIYEIVNSLKQNIVEHNFSLSKTKK